MDAPIFREAVQMGRFGSQLEVTLDTDTDFDNHVPDDPVAIEDTGYILEITIYRGSADVYFNELAGRTKRKDLERIAETYFEKPSDDNVFELELDPTHVDDIFALTNAIYESLHGNRTIGNTQLWEQLPRTLPDDFERLSAVYEPDEEIEYDLIRIRYHIPQEVVLAKDNAA